VGWYVHTFPWHSVQHPDEKKIRPIKVTSKAAPADLFSSHVSFLTEESKEERV